jgi:hypothetical protein
VRLPSRGKGIVGCLTPGIKLSKIPTSRRVAQGRLAE